MRKQIMDLIHALVWKALVALDIAVNRLFNGRVETISSRAGRARASGRVWGCVLCKILDDIQPNHCANAMKKPSE